MALLLVACASSPQRDDLDLRLEAGTRAFGGGFEYLYVKSAGPNADRAFITVSRTTGPSQLARDLATRIAPAERTPVRMLVTGPNAEKTLQVVRDALSFHRRGRLPHLELLLLGVEDGAAGLRETVDRLGARLRFAPFPG